MRWLIPLVLVFALGFTAEAKNNPVKFDGRLLNYDQLMSLSSKKRMQYMKDLVEVLAVMEKGQSKYEIASNDSFQRLKEYVAAMTEMLAVLPQADAQEAAGSLNRPGMVPRWGDKGWECTGQNVVFDASIGTCVLTRKTMFGATVTKFSANQCPEFSTAAYSDKSGPRKCVPNEAWFALSRERRRDIGRGNTLAPNFFQVDRGAEDTMDVVLGGGTHKPDGTLVADAAPDKEPNEPTTPTGDDKHIESAQCEKPTFACAALPEPERNALVKEFRANDDKTCVAGGFITEYKNGEKKVGNCKRSAEFTFPGTTKPVKCPAKKKPTDKDKVMCNPTVFCLGLKVDDTLKNLVSKDKSVSGQFGADAATAQRTIDRMKLKHGDDNLMQMFVCADLGQDLTKKCDMEIEKHLAKQTSAIGKKNKGESYVRCDAHQLKWVTDEHMSAAEKDENAKKNLALKIQREKAWNELTAQVREKYQSMCSNNQQEFTALFCDECKIIADRIGAMNDKATGNPCPFAAIAPPAGTKSGAPEAVK